MKKVRITNLRSSSFKDYYLVVFVLILSLSCKSEPSSLLEAGQDWPVYLGGNSSAQYSPIDQINKANVNELKVAWEFSTGDAAPDGKSQMQCNPIIIDGILYGSSPKLKIFALNAATGELLWMHDPNAEINYGRNFNRGVTYHKEGSEERIFLRQALFCSV